MATKKKPRQKKGRQLIIDQVERKLLGEPEPKAPYVEEAVLGTRPPKLRREKDGKLTCPVHHHSWRSIRRRPGRWKLQHQMGSKLFITRTSLIIYVNTLPYCAGCWDIIEGGSPDGNTRWKFMRMKFREEKRAFLMHRTRAARNQQL